MSVQPYIKKLFKAPLQEVIFELKWELERLENSTELFDKGFDIALGKFQQRISNNFQFHKRLSPPMQVPLSFFNFKPIHQFWSKENEWPVVQLGPGIMSVNDTEKNYIWEDTFKPIVLKSMDMLFESYDNNLTVKQATLRYIDAVSLENEENDRITKFIENYLKIKIEKNFAVDGVLANLSLNQLYNLSNGSKLNIVVSNGFDTKAKRPALIWHTAVIIDKKMSLDEVKVWIGDAHTVTHALFLEMTKGDFYDSFSETV